LTASTLKRIDPTLVELEFDVPAAEMEKAREKAFRDLARHAKVPGFRPGKVPRKLFEANYGTEGIEERARDEVLGEAYSKAVQENAIEPVERAQLEEVPADGGTEVRFRARFAVRPQIELKQYKGISVTSPSTAVTDDDVAESLEQLRRGEAQLVPAERPVQLGDVATLDYEGKIDGEAFEGGSATNQPTEIAPGRFIPGFVEGIVGMAAGETRDVSATFPADYSKSEYAGKTAVFAVTVHDVKVPELPPLDDEFAGRFASAAATLEALRVDIRARLERAKGDNARKAMTGELLEKLRDEHDVPLPEVLVAREVEALLEDTKSQADRARLDWATFLEHAGKTEDGLRAEARPAAERRVKTDLLLHAISRAENIAATERDVDAELASLSAQYGRPKGEILEMMRPNIQALLDGIVRSKTLDFLVEWAQRVEATSGAGA